MTAIKGLIQVSLIGCLWVGSAALASESVLRDFLSEVTTLEADFTQQIVDEYGMTLDQTRGKVSLQRPGKFRWDYRTRDNSPGQQLVADGQQIFLFDPDLEQVTQRSIQDAINQVPSLLLVQDGAVLDKFFTISDIGLTDGLTWVALKPKSEDASFQQLLIGFVQGQLSEIHLLDGLGNETRLTLKNVIANQALPTKRFVFNPPEGVDVLAQ